MISKNNIKYVRSLALKKVRKEEKAFVAEGLDKTENDLYKKIIKYKKILQTPEKNRNPYKIFAGVASVILLVLTAFSIYNKRVGKNDFSSQTFSPHQDKI